MQMLTTLIPLCCISRVVAGPYPTQPAASWDTAPARTRGIHQRRYQWALAFVYILLDCDSKQENTLRHLPGDLYCDGL